MCKYLYTVCCFNKAVLSSHAGRVSEFEMSTNI